MKILFSPSESKIFKPNGENSNNFSIEPNKELLKRYEYIINNSNYVILKKLFGIKKEAEIDNIIKLYNCTQLTKTIELYDGIAYKALNYSTLNEQEKKYIDQNTLIFSNLFGPINANSNIPYYKLKQGEKLDNINIENCYKNSSNDKITNYLSNDFIVDLRAKFYEKFYTIKKEHVTFTFMKSGKIITHYSKKYRGLLLREFAKQNTKYIDKTFKMEGIKYIESKKEKLKETLIYEIIS